MRGGESQSVEGEGEEKAPEHQGAHKGYIWWSMSIDMVIKKKETRTLATKALGTLMNVGGRDARNEKGFVERGRESE